MKFNSKHKKYNTGNPISLFLIERFFRSIKSLVKSTSDFDNVLDVGCGEGFLLSFLEIELNGKNVRAIDFDAKEVASAKENINFAVCEQGDIYNLKFADRSYELVFCTEVLEHLEFPEKALKELKRVTAKYCIVTVPNEPLWCMLNLLRGAYISSLGNTPGHINHWTTNQIKKLVSEYFNVIQCETSMPWTILLCRKNE